MSPILKVPKSLRLLIDVGVLPVAFTYTVQLSLLSDTSVALYHVFVDSVEELLPVPDCEPDNLQLDHK